MLGRQEQWSSFQAISNIMLTGRISSCSRIAFTKCYNQWMKWTSKLGKILSYSTTKYISANSSTRQVDSDLFDETYFRCRNNLTLPVRIALHHITSHHVTLHWWHCFNVEIITLCQLSNSLASTFKQHCCEVEILTLFQHQNSDIVSILKFWHHFNFKLMLLKPWCTFLDFFGSLICRTHGLSLTVRTQSQLKHGQVRLWVP